MPPSSTVPDVTIFAVGDLQLGDSPTAVGFGFYSRYASRPIGPLFDAVQAQLAEADLAFGNLECTLSRAGVVVNSWKSVHLRGEPAFLPQLRRAGFTILNVANNHAVQHGDATFHETVAMLREAGIAACGIKGTDGWAAQPTLVVTRHGAHLGILGYCLRPRQYGAADPPYAEGDETAICADVRRLRPTVDRVVVSLHWGEEFVDEPSRDEITMARAIIDAGASVILGHHPHVVRPVEQYAGGVIAYSLGNFVADMVWQDRLRRGAVLRCTLPAGGEARAEVWSTFIGADYRPQLEGPLPVTPAASLPGLPSDAYAREVDRTVRAQQWAGYRHALRNLWKFPPAIVGQLLVRTARNKAVRAWYRAKGEPLPF